MLYINGNNLDLDHVVAVARKNQSVQIAPETWEQISLSHSWIKDIIATGKPVYGINTGFGVFADQRISPAATRELNRNLILSHSVGTGPSLPVEIVRASMLIRANTLARGHSAVRPVVVDTIIKMLNSGVTPIVPSQGSLGSSGDLAQLSHLALVFTTDAKDDEAISGLANFQGECMSGKKAMLAAGIPRIILEHKEGLALINGATFSAAMAALATNDAQHLIRVAEIGLSLSLEGLLGKSAAFDPRIHQARHHPGQIDAAQRVLGLIKGSTLVDASGHVQDAYSLRCSPQVHGAVSETIGFARSVIKREINSSTDNPLLFSPEDILSGGNFHGEPVGLAMDFLAIAVAELGAISERRIFRLVDGKLNQGLPPMLVENLDSAGINSGMMMPQYTAASLVLENQTLASPDSIHSLPTSGEQEDHNANALTAARHTWQVIENVYHILAVEIYCATRAIDLRLKQMPDRHCGTGTSKAYQAVRAVVAHQPGDALWGPEIETVKRLIKDEKFVHSID